MNATRHRRLIALLGAPVLVVVACRSVGATVQANPGAEHLQAGIALFQQGKFAEAEARLRQATGTDASAYLAASLARQKRHAEAEAPARAALEANPLHEVALAALGESLVGQKKYDDAIARLTTALQAKPDIPYAYYWRGMAYYAKKQPDRMVGDFEAFLTLAPEAPEAPTVRQLLAGLR